MDAVDLVGVGCDRRSHNKDGRNPRDGPSDERHGAIANQCRAPRDCGKKPCCSTFAPDSSSAGLLNSSGNLCHDDGEVGTSETDMAVRRSIIEGWRVRGSEEIFVSLTLATRWSGCGSGRLEWARGRSLDWLQGHILAVPCCAVLTPNCGCEEFGWCLVDVAKGLSRVQDTKRIRKPGHVDLRSAWTLDDQRDVAYEA